MTEDITIEIVRLSSAVAELRLRPNRPDVELRGKMTGPHHPTTTTMEVAYPLKPADGGAMKVVIPDPNLWTTETAFTYRGRIELWQNGQRIGERDVEIGLKIA